MQQFESFRDPLGKVFLNGTDVWRTVVSSEADSLNEFLELGLAKEWQATRKLVPTWRANDLEVNSFRSTFRGKTNGKSELLLLKHERLAFPSFPYEWSPEMLFDAGRLTMEAAEQFFIKTGWSIKDASPFNILFDGPRPVFVDILSFEKRKRHDPIWLAFNQFVQSFLLPLLVNRELGLSIRTVFLGSRDGLHVSEAVKLLGRWKRLKPSIFTLATLPHLLARPADGAPGIYRAKEIGSPEIARFIFIQTLRRLRKHLSKAEPSHGTKSKWTEYTTVNQKTIPEYVASKLAFVTSAFTKLNPKNVLDVGCNTGFFSLEAARAGARVVAIDHDEAVIDQVYRSARKADLSVLPLVMNLSHPTPRLGWRFSETPSFLDRAIGRFDMVMMLAVVHHMLVLERVPLCEIMRLAADLTKDRLIIEFVPPNDPMFLRLARGRDHLHSDLTPDSFVQCASEFFRVELSELLPKTQRRIYLMRKK